MVYFPYFRIRQRYAEFFFNDFYRFIEIFLGKISHEFPDHRLLLKRKRSRLALSTFRG